MLATSKVTKYLIRAEKKRIGVQNAVKTQPPVFPLLSSLYCFHVVAP